MKIFLLTLFLYSSLWATCNTFAANHTLLTNYPAPSGSYNQLVLENLQTLPNCSLSSNAGLIYVNTTTNALELCANGSTVTVPYPETCFNRFWNSGGTAPPNGCPTINGKTYVQGTIGGTPMVDNFQSAAGFTVYSTVCCSPNSAVRPQ